MKKLHIISLCAYLGLIGMEETYSPLQAQFINTFTKKMIALSPEKNTTAFVNLARNELYSFFSTHYTRYTPKELSKQLEIPHDTYKKAYEKTIVNFDNTQMDELFTARRLKI